MTQSSGMASASIPIYTKFRLASFVFTPTRQTIWQNDLRRFPHHRANGMFDSTCIHTASLSSSPLHRLIIIRNQHLFSCLPRFLLVPILGFSGPWKTSFVHSESSYPLVCPTSGLISLTSFSPCAGLVLNLIPLYRVQIFIVIFIFVYMKQSLRKTDRGFLRLGLVSWE